MGGKMKQVRCAFAICCIILSTSKVKINVLDFLHSQIYQKLFSYFSPSQSSILVVCDTIESILILCFRARQIEEKTLQQQKSSQGTLIEGTNVEKNPSINQQELRQQIEFCHLSPPAFRGISNDKECVSSGFFFVSPKYLLYILTF